MTQNSLPVLQIAIPLIAAPLCVVIRDRKIVLACTIAVCWATFAMSVALLHRVLSQGVVTYELGGWPAPWGIEYRVDALNAFVMVFVAAMGALVITYAPSSLEREIARSRHYLFYVMYLLCLTGLLGICITGDLFNLFVFLECDVKSWHHLHQIDAGSVSVEDVPGQ